MPPGNATCWCCQGSIVVTNKSYKPHTCLECDENRHPSTELYKDTFACSVVCGKCRLTRLVILQRKSAVELFRNRLKIKCKGCKSLDVELKIELDYKSGGGGDAGSGDLPILAAKEWRGKEPKEIAHEEAE